MVIVFFDEEEDEYFVDDCWGGAFGDCVEVEQVEELSCTGVG